jgi:hypothetical protein
MIPREPPRTRWAVEAAAAFAAYAATTLWFLRPMLRVWRDHLAPDTGDPLYLLYVLEWSGRQLRLGMPAPLDANFYHPLADALTLSDHFFGPAALALPITSLTGSAVAGYNFVLLLAFALSGTTTFLVLRAAGSSRVAAAVGGFIFAFTPYRWDQTSHLQIVFAPWVPVVLWTFDRLLADPRPRRALLFLCVYALHLGGGTYLAYMIHVPLLVLLLNRAASPAARRRWRERSARLGLAVTAGVSATMLLALFLPYVETSLRLDLQRGAAEYRLFGASLPAYLTPSRYAWYHPVVAPALRATMPRFGDAEWLAEKTLFPGFLPAVLVLAAVAALWSRHRVTRPPQPPWRRTVLVAVVALALGVFVVADLFTLGWLEAPGALADHAGVVYSSLGLLLVVLFAVWAALRRYWRLGAPLDLAAIPAWTRGVALATACTFLFAFPVVFTPAAELVPGLAGMRAPARFFVFTAFGLAVFAAQGTDRLLAWVRQRTGRNAPAVAAGVLLVALLLAESVPRPLPWTRVPLQAEFPPVYSWLAEHRGEVGAVLELPFREPPGEVWYMYFSTLHWLPLVNGYSAHVPDFHQDLRDVCCPSVPPPEVMAELRAVGVTHLVLHPVVREGGDRRRYERWLRQVARGLVPGTTQVYAAADGTRVLSIEAAPPGRRATIRR